MTALAAFERLPEYDVAGLPSAPLMVLIHGSVVSRTMWRPQVLAFADRFRVLAPDLPGHGTAASIPFTFEAATDVIARVVRGQTSPRALLVGLSLGGYVAIETAVRHPHLVTGLVLCGTTVNFRGALGLYLRSVSWLMRHGVIRISAKGLEERIRRLFPASMAEVANLQIQDGIRAEPLGQAFRELASKDFISMLASVRCPVLIVNGERDRQARRGERAFAAAARGTIQTIRGAGHACNLDQPELFHAVVREFALQRPA